MSKVKKLRGRPPIYPFGSMKVGESHTFPKAKRSTISVAAYNTGKRRGWTFTCKTVNKLRIRITRTK